MDNSDNNSDRFGEVVGRETVNENETSDKDVQVAEKSETIVPEKTEETQETEQTQENKGTIGAETQEPQLTEKGTKLDPNPQSAVHQELANERRVRSQMEQVLGNKEKLAQFMERQYGVKQPSQEATVETPEVKAYKAEDFENLEDVAEVVNKLQNGFSEKSKTYEEKIQELTKVVGGLLQGSRNSQIATKTESDVNSLRGIPELDSKSPDFIPGLEEKITQEYLRRDFDETTRQFKGEHSIADIGNYIIDVARTAKKAGSQEAQTIVKDKSEGRVKTSPKANGDTSSDNLAPGDSIAKGIAKMFR